MANITRSSPILIPDPRRNQHFLLRRKFRKRLSPEEECRAIPPIYPVCKEEVESLLWPRNYHCEVARSRSWQHNVDDVRRPVFTKPYFFRDLYQPGAQDDAEPAVQKAQPKLGVLQEIVRPRNYQGHDEENGEEEEIIPDEEENIQDLQ